MKHIVPIIMVLLLKFLDVEAAMPLYCQTGLVCTNSTHFRLCVANGNGSVSLWDHQNACPANTTCNGSQCVDNRPPSFAPQFSTACGTHGFICIDNYHYQLCRHEGYSVTWGPVYNCPGNTHCNNSYIFHCYYNNPPAISYQTEPPRQPPVLTPNANSNAPKVTEDKCKSKSFICLDNKRYLLCRLTVNGYEPYGTAYDCPPKQFCQKAFDTPCAVGKSHGNIISANVLITLFVSLIFVKVNVL